MSRVPPPPPLERAGNLPTFASSPGNRFWGANELFAFDAPGTAPFDGPLEPGQRSGAPAAVAAATSTSRPDQQIPPLDPLTRGFEPSPADQEAELSRLLTGLALPLDGTHLAARRLSPQPPLLSPRSPGDPNQQQYFGLSPSYSSLPNQAAPQARGYTSPHPAVSGPPHIGTYPNGLGSIPNRLKQDPNEEITTIFLAGFPDDITEREFSNYFVFARGFEAASLKFPSLPPPNQDEPYLTLGAAGPMLASSSGGTVPRSRNEQISGFAKFRTRQEALLARDFLNGRLVDPERGCVLKTEMAKKNLHTKSIRMSNPSSLSSPPSGSAQQGHHGSLSLQHPNSLPRQTERYFLPPDLRNPTVGMGPSGLGSLPNPLSAGVNSLGEASNLANGSMIGSAALDPLSPTLHRSSGSISPLGGVPLTASLSGITTTTGLNSSSSPAPVFSGKSGPSSVSDRVTSPTLSRPASEAQDPSVGSSSMSTHPVA